ncbi:MAG: transcriptional regulator, TraR/DksA family [Frankiales bacterium]|nr:transcriptional regulator, TraR/DksA family [Frankiales bacterium]
MTSTDLQQVRTQLERTLAELDSTTETLKDEGAGETSELSHLKTHPGDVGTEVADNDREIAILEASAGQREQVVAALARLDAGTYGVCVDCGQPITPERLEARPEVARCLADQEKSEARA